MSSIETIKKSLRAKLLARRRAIHQDIVAEQSCKIAENVCSSMCFQSAQTVMMYIAMPDEPSLAGLVQYSIKMGKRLCMPMVRPQRGYMDAVLFPGFDSLVEGQFGLLIPKPEVVCIIPPEEIDLVLVPAVGYDRVGHRLGMGAGYYDRFLPLASKAVRLGTVWQCCVIEQVPADSFDQPVDYLVTEKGIIPCRKGKM